MRLSEHPAFAHVDIAFVNHIQKILDNSTCRNSVDAIQKLMLVSQEIDKNNVTFTPEMQNVLLTYFKNKLPKNQRSQFNAVLGMVQQLQRNQQH